MTSEQPGSLRPDVLLSGSALGPDLGGQRAPGRHFEIVRHPDHIVWRRGTATRLWRLPGQDAADTALPVLASVTRAEVARGRRTALGAVCLLDGEGVLLAALASGSAQRLDAIWPDRAFDGLARHGVEVRRDEFASAAALPNAYRGAFGAFASLRLGVWRRNV